jgi:hypothetical protein
MGGVTRAGMVHKGRVSAERFEVEPAATEERIRPVIAIPRQ